MVNKIPLLPLVKYAKIFRYYLEYIFVHAAFKIFTYFSIKTASEICGVITQKVAKIICIINGRHKKALTNLSLCFPNKSKAELNSIMNAFYKNMGRFIGEYINQKQMDKSYFQENVEIINGEILDEYLKKGFFGITAHFGNWELLHKYVSIKGEKLNVIYRRQNNLFIEKAFIDNRPVNLIDKNSNAMRQIIPLIKLKKIIGILIDQRDNAGKKYFFFGRPAKTGAAIQRLSLKYNYPMIMVKCVRKKEDPSKFRMVFYPPLQITLSGNLEQDTQTLTNKTLELLEQWIKEDPEQWFWIYNRWK